MAHIQPLRGFAVLVVEDDADTLASVASLIRDILGCEVLTAVSGDDALRLVDAGFRVDLLFADVVMPGMDGIALTQRIRERLSNLPLVLTTGLPSAVDMALECAAITLVKPYLPEQLEAIFAEQLLGKSPASCDSPTATRVQRSVISEAG